MAETTVKRIHESMRGAPVLNGVAGSLITLLDTFLVNGWGLATANSATVSGGVATITMPAGSAFEDHCVVLVAGATPAALNGEQRIATTDGTTLTFPTTAANGPATGTITVKYAPCGWEKVFSGTNVAVYRSQNIQGPRRYFRVDDTGSTDARLRGFEAMTDANTGTNPFPTDAQLSGGGYLSRAMSAGVTAQRYDCVGDDRFFYYGYCPYWAYYPASASTDTYTAGRYRALGEPVPFKQTGDAWCSMLLAATVANNYSNANGSLDGGLSAGVFTERAVSAVPGSVATYVLAETTGSNSNVSGGDSNALGAFPNAVDGKLRLTRYLLRVSTSDWAPRAALPGAWRVPQTGLSSYPAFKARDTIDGTGVLAGRKLILLWVGSMSKDGGFFVDITGPWR